MQTMNQSSRSLSFSLLMILGVATVAISNGKVFAQNRLFLSVDRLTGGANRTQIGEVDLTSESFDYDLIFEVPTPPGGDFVIDGARDLVVDEQGNFHVYNGTFTVSLLSSDATGESITQNVIPGLTTVNNTNFGGIARQGDVVFLTDQFTLQGGEPLGIVRVDLEDQSFDRIATDLDPRLAGGPIDINIGLDGTLLAVIERSDNIYRYDAQSGELLNTIEPFYPIGDIRGVAGAADGTVYVVTFQGDVLQYDNNGNVLRSLEVNGRTNSTGSIFNSRLHDIDIAPDGQIAIGTTDGSIVLTTTALESAEVISISDQIPFASSANIFVAFATDFSVGPLLGDVNVDGVVNFLDISPFIAILSVGGFQEEADIDQNTTVDFRDISPFIELLSSP